MNYLLFVLGRDHRLAVAWQWEGCSLTVRAYQAFDVLVLGGRVERDEPLVEAETGFVGLIPGELAGLVLPGQPETAAGGWRRTGAPSAGRTRTAGCHRTAYLVVTGRGH